MKLGDMMKAENATFGISFCGSWRRRRHHCAEQALTTRLNMVMRSVDGRDRYQRRLQRSGSGFMDKEELGERPVEALEKEIRRVSMKEQFTTTVSVKERRKQNTAFADALNHVQAAVMKTSPHILLRIEPQDERLFVRMKRRAKKRLCSSLRRERRTYSVELDVTVNVTAINVDKVDFITQT